MTCLRTAAALTLAFLAVACSGRPEHRGLPRPRAIDQSPVLAPFASCDALEREIEDGLVLQMRSVLEQWRGGVVAGGDGAGPVAATPGPSQYTTTNSQVEGVGEA
ncbi:MAG TPA: hypothetical protein VIW03_14590, partial [Anaeromyxobacter sp.]